MCRYLFIAMVLLPYGNTVFSDEDFKIVLIEHGTLRGRWDGNGYYAYLGIPYAAPPTGDSRFMAPSPVKPWDGIYEANREVHCPQNGHGEEDCLILNVFVPENVTNRNLPVLVYIHGGSFIMGAGQTTGVEPLTAQGLIVVTINYRLGALGFLCLGTNDAPGNAGLKDQVAALKWVQKNIGSFGGDPKRVTLYGMSAGAASVDLLVLSKATEGLFQRAILESGAATNVWAVDIDPLERAVDVALKHSSKTIDNIKELIEFYQTVPADVISLIGYDLYETLTDGTFGFAPCVEKPIEGVTPFLTESPFTTLDQQTYRKVPVLMMYATLEGLYLRSAEFQDYATKMEDNFEEFLPADLEFVSNEQRSEIAKFIKHYYFGNRLVSFDTIIGYLNYFGDSHILHQFLNSADAHSENNTVYLMEFSFHGNMEDIDEMYNNILAAGHGSVIKHAILQRPILDYKDQLAVDRVSTMIANFVMDGKPIPRPSCLLPTKWPRYKQTSPKYLRLDQSFGVGDHPYWDRKFFWDDIYAKCQRRPRVPVDPAAVTEKFKKFYD